MEAIHHGPRTSLDSLAGFEVHFSDKEYFLGIMFCFHNLTHTSITRIMYIANLDKSFQVEADPV